MEQHLEQGWCIYWREIKLSPFNRISGPKVYSSGVITEEIICLPLLEFWVQDSVGETFSANTDTFKYTVTVELMEYKMMVNKT